MGTRNLVAVVQGGEFRVAQYGQWDGYPDGQGRTVLEFLREQQAADGCTAFRTAVGRCRFGTEAADGSLGEYAPIALACKFRLDDLPEFRVFEASIRAALRRRFGECAE